MDGIPECVAPTNTNTFRYDPFVHAETLEKVMTSSRHLGELVEFECALHSHVATEVRELDFDQLLRVQRPMPIPSRKTHSSKHAFEVYSGAHAHLQHDTGLGSTTPAV